MVDTDKDIVGITIEALFGQHCSGSVFRHDEFMEQKAGVARVGGAKTESQVSTASTASSIPHVPLWGFSVSGEDDVQQTAADAADTAVHKAGGIPPHEVDSGVSDQKDEEYEESGYSCTRGSQDSDMSQQALETRKRAFHALLDNARNNAGWEIGLICTKDNHSVVEQDLGTL